MNELSILTNDLANAKSNELSKILLKVFTAITPQFNKGKSTEDLQAEKSSIELLTSGIEAPVLSVMCKLAIKQYPLERSRNGKTFFDINYLLTFYEKAFNYFWCDSIKVDKDCQYKGFKFNEYTNILTEDWESNGKIFQIKYIVSQKKLDSLNSSFKNSRIYSPKYFEWIMIGEIEGFMKEG